MTNCLIKDNSAFYGGGIAYCYGVVARNTFENNEALEDPKDASSGAGGAIHECKYLIGNTIVNNSAALRAGGMSLDACTGAMWTNNVVFGNEIMDTEAPETYGAGIDLLEHAQGAHISHNTIVENIGGNADANAIIAEDATFTNNIVWGNYDGDSNDDYDRLSPIAKYCQIQGAPLKVVLATPYNFGDAPQFADQGSLDFHLTASSPAVNAGAPLLPPIRRDLDGIIRLEVPDVGAYEYIGNLGGSYVYISGDSYPSEGHALALTANLSADMIAAGCTSISYAWTHNGESIGSNNATLTIEDIAPEFSDDVE